MEKYFNQNFLFMAELLNQDCLDKFYGLIKNEINKLINNKDYEYYLYIKHELYKKLTLLYSFYEKIKSPDTNIKQINIIDKLIESIMQNYNIKTNILRKYNFSNKDLICYEDLLYMNLKNIEEVKNVLFNINENNKGYNKKVLPNNINIMEINNFKICFHKSQTKYNIVYYNYQYKLLIYLKTNKKQSITKHYYKINKMYNNMLIFINEMKFQNIYYYKYKYLYIKYILLKYDLNCKNINKNNKTHPYHNDKYIKKIIIFIKKGIGDLFFHKYKTL